MATSQTTSTGRNRGARRGSDTPIADPKGATMTGKDQKQAVSITVQTDPKNVEGLKIDRKTLDAAAKIIGGFHKANDELQTLKDDVEKKRGGLSDICFQLAKLGAAAADKPEHRLAACLKVFDGAEAYERQRYQKANKLADLPTAREALGASWQTYKSQILKCVRAGLNPEDFANGTVYREALSKTGNQSRRGARTSAASAGTQTATGVLEEASTSMRTELSASITDLVKHVQQLDEEKQLDFAARIHRITIAAAKLLKGSEPAADQTETRDTATMQ